MSDQLFGGAMLLGLLAAFWQRVKMLLSKVTSLLIVTADVREEAFVAVRLYLRDHFKASRFGSRIFGAENLHIRPQNQYGMVGLEEIFSQDTLFFWRGWRFMTITFVPGDNHKNGSFPTGRMSFVRGTFVLETFLFAALEYLNKTRRSGSESNVQRFEVIRKSGRGRSRYGEQKMAEAPSAHTVKGPACAAAERLLVGWQAEDIGPPLARGDLWDVLAFPQSVKNCIVEMEHWLRSKEWYLEKQIAWRRGWLLTSKPGNGKTSLIRAMGQKLNMPVISFDLSTYGNDDFAGHWRDLYAHTPCIAVIEDIDCVFEGRRNILGEDTGGLTYDCLLNCLSGLEVADGVFTVITTNRPETLDEALGQVGSNGRATRPGRIDRIIELPSLDTACRRQLARRILADAPSLIEETVRAGDGDTGAQFQDRCCQLALDHRWGLLEGEALAG